MTEYRYFWTSKTCCNQNYLNSDLETVGLADTASNEQMLRLELIYFPMGKYISSNLNICSLLDREKASDTVNFSWEQYTVMAKLRALETGALPFQH